MKKELVVTLILLTLYSQGHTTTTIRTKKDSSLNFKRSNSFKTDIKEEEDEEKSKLATDLSSYNRGVQIGLNSLMKFCESESLNKSIKSISKMKSEEFITLARVKLVDQYLRASVQKSTVWGILKNKEKIEKSQNIDQETLEAVKSAPTFYNAIRESSMALFDDEIKIENWQEKIFESSKSLNKFCDKNRLFFLFFF